ncbi:MAG: hypothetical protein KDD55_03470 [Bdellovibrionales bacterium]|nr:hypothetical protein [Bdellovibrionales bacterium]
MEVGLLPTLNSQLVRLDRTYGSDALAVDFVHALMDTLKKFEGDRSIANLRVELLHLYDLFLASRPRMSNLSLDLQKLVLFIDEHPDATTKDLHTYLVEFLALKRTRRKSAVEHAIELITPQTRLLVHSYSSTLMALLAYCAKKDKRPKVSVAGQDQIKTDKIVRHLNEHGYTFQVVSEYAISHVINEIDLAFFGGLTLNAREQVVLGPGSASLISQLRSYQIACYVLLTCNKFSFWDERSELAFREARKKSLDHFTYEKHVFSHDVLPLKSLTGVITERGVKTPEQAVQLFTDLQAWYLGNEKKIRGE